MGVLTFVLVLFALVCIASCDSPATITEISNGKIPLSSTVFANCPSSKQYAALSVKVKTDIAYYACFDVNQKTPVFTVNEIQFLSDKDLSRPDVDPWYPFNNNRAYGNGKSIIGGYDRGHLTPSADFERTNTEMMASTFHIFNRAAQVAAFNRNEWRMLETTVRTWVQKIETTCANCNTKIITGCTTKSIGVTREAVGVTLPIPKYYYKIVMVLNGAQSYAVLFYGSNDIQLSKFPISVIGSSADISNIPTEIQQDLSNVLGLADLLYKNPNGLLRKNGKTMLFNQVAEATKRFK